VSLRASERHDRVAAACLASLLVLFAMSVLATTRPVAQPRPLALAAAPGSQLSRNGEAVVLGGGRDGAAAAQLRFDLPAGGGWVLWFDRVPVDALWLERPGWASVRRDFFAPAEEEGALPAGFLFPLPADWHGEVALTLHARGSVRAVLHPRLLPATNAGRVGNRALALQAAVYGGLFVIALLAVALYSAARERAFLVLSGGSAVALLAVAAGNGHLYALPLLSAFGAWRGAGLWALQLLFCTATLQALRRYAALREGSVGGLRWFDLASLLPVFAALAYGIAQLMARQIGASESAAVMGFYQNVMYMIGAIVLALLFGHGAFAYDNMHPSVAFLLRPWSFERPFDLFLLACCGPIAAAGTVL